MNYDNLKFFIIYIKLSTFIYSSTNFKNNAFHNSMKLIASFFLSAQRAFDQGRHLGVIRGCGYTPYF